MAERMCSHGCGNASGNDGYCDWCYADQCLIGPDGLCKYTAQATDDTLGPCGCTDYHMADCPIRSGG